MATLHLMVGLPGSGKTTRAKELERALPAIRLTPDEWHLRLFGQDLDDPEHDSRHSAIEALLWEIAERVLMQGLDVILDFGFWSRAERDEFRRRALSLRASPVIHYAPTTTGEILTRLAARNAALPATAFRISEEMILKWAKLFEPPADDELAASEA
ncbi:AAA family ATPase [Achromobacter sp. NPDC058515]|uniref:AAA family ATPase n=1 Tax=Achromobacter sp. NPDC058515 TaxID=3346533 RepID=UPI00365686E1